VLPKSVHPQGKDIRVIAQFARHSGKPVASEPHYPLGLSAQVLAPTGAPASIQFGEPRNGNYYGEPAVATKLPGLYRIALRVQAGNALDASRTYYVNVKPVPYLALAPPRVVGLPFAQRYLNLDGDLMLAAKPIEPAKVFTNHPNLLYLAQIPQMPNGDRSPTVWMANTGAYHFSAQFRLPMQSRLGVRQPLAGDYLILTEHAGKAVNPADAGYTDPNMVPAAVSGSPLGTLVAVLVAFLLLYALVVALSWASLVYKLLTARKMRLDVALLHSRTGEQLAQPRLAGRSWASVRTRQWKGPQPQQGRKAAMLRSRRFFFWGIDKAATTIGFARIWGGIVVVGRVRQRSGRTIGQVKIQA